MWSVQFPCYFRVLVSVTNNILDKYFSSLTFQLKYRHLKTQLREENGM